MSPLWTSVFERPSQKRGEEPSAKRGSRTETTGKEGNWNGKRRFNRSSEKRRTGLLGGKEAARFLRSPNEEQEKRRV